MVRGGGIEPPRVTPPDPKSGASTIPPPSHDGQDRGDARGAPVGARCRPAPRAHCGGSRLAAATALVLALGSTAWGAACHLLWPAGWAVVSIALASGCGRPTAAGHLERIDLAPAEDAPGWPESRVVLGLPAGAGWRGVAPTTEWVDADPPRLLLFDPQGSSALAASLSGPVFPLEFNQVEVSMLSQAPGELSVEFLLGDELVGVAPPVPLVVSSQVEPLALEATAAYRPPVPFDRLVIKCSSSARRVELEGVRLVNRPVEAWLPDPAGPAQLVPIFGDAVSAEGLSSVTPLTAGVRIPEDGRLSFLRAWPLACRADGQRPRLYVRVAAGESVVEQRFAFDDGIPRWEAATLDLAELAGADARITFRLDADGPLPSACALGELRLWAPGAAPRTVLFVTSDTHRADHLGASRAAVGVLTPSLDALASHGVLFEDCYAVTNVTNPSHVAMMTGVHPAETGILHNSLPLRAAAPTLAEAFAAAGFRTLAVISAQHLGDPGSGLGQGFDRMSWPARHGTRSAAESVALARAWLDESAGEPVFIWLHLFDAHGPYTPPPRWRHQYWPDDRDPFDPDRPAPDLPEGVLPPELTGLRDLDYPAAAYKGEVSSLDEQLAGLLAAPRVSAGVVAVTGDHGESFGQHGIWFTHAGLYPDTLHVPLVFAFPGAPAGSVVDGPVGHLDLAATLLDLAGVAGHGLPGRSFAGVARGETGRASPRFALSAHGFSASVTDGRWHLILHLRDQAQRQMTSHFARHQVQLYDLQLDPGCDHDHASEQHGRAAELRARLVEWLSSRHDRGWAGDRLDDPERAAQLAALGYVEVADDPARTLWEPDRCERCLPFLDDGPASLGDR